VGLKDAVSYLFIILVVNLSIIVNHLIYVTIR